MKRFSTLWLCCVVALCGYCRNLSLRECVALALENNRELLNAQLGVTKSRLAVTQNRSNLLPVITGSMQVTGYLLNPVNVTTGVLLGNEFQDNPTWQTIKSMPYNANAGVQLSLPVYNKSIFASVDVANTVEQIAALSYDKGVETLTIGVSKLYYMAQSYREQVELLDENISKMEELYEITAALFSQGVVLEVDLNRININLQNLRAMRGTYFVLYEQQVNRLKYLMDLPSDENIGLTHQVDTVAPIEINTPSDNLPELMIARQQQHLSEQRIKAVKAGYIPSIGFTAYVGGVGYQEKFGDFFHGSAASRNWFGNSFIGVSVKIPIFDANAKKHRISQYRIDLQQAENNYEMLHSQVEADFKNASLQMNQNLDIYHTQMESYRQAQSVYALTTEQYREGVGSMTALLQDEMQMRTAQSLCVQARCQFYLAQLELLKLSGNLSKIME